MTLSDGWFSLALLQQYFPLSIPEQKITRAYELFLLMGSVKVIISDAVERKFRRVAMKRYGYGKGALSKAAEAAFDNWSSREDTDFHISEELENDPVGAIEGLLKSVKESSVQLQHEANKIRVKKASAKSSN